MSRAGVGADSRAAARRERVADSDRLLRWLLKLGLQEVRTEGKGQARTIYSLSSHAPGVIMIRESA